MAYTKHLLLSGLLCMSCIAADDATAEPQSTTEQQTADQLDEFRTTLSADQQASFDDFCQEIAGLEAATKEQIEALKTDCEEAITQAIDGHQEVLELFKKHLGQEDLYIKIEEPFVAQVQF